MQTLARMGRGDLVQCGKCGLNFLHEEGLGKHMKRVHEPKEEVQASRYKCDRCAEEFHSKDGFKKHKLPEELRWAILSPLEYHHLETGMV